VAGRLILRAAAGFAKARAVFQIIGSVMARRGEMFRFHFAFRFIEDDTRGLL
jgi:hypothetical protein